MTTRKGAAAAGRQSVPSKSAENATGKDARHNCFPFETLGFEGPGAVYYNLRPAELYEQAVRRGEGRISSGGALAVETGLHTGRSAQDKFIVSDDLTAGKVWWENNRALDPRRFETLYNDMLEHARGMDLYAQDLYGGADPHYRIGVRVITEYAWHALFIRNLLIRPEEMTPAAFEVDLTIINLPGFRAHPDRHGSRTETMIACDFDRRVVLICGTSYAGEMKKSVFSFLNFVLPQQDVMPMHCSANVGGGGDAAVFFGLSGTGKTTLSADPERELIGDDEHGWGKNGIFNFEGGCYAKTMRLSLEAEPEIYATTQRFGTVLENVVLDDERRPDFDDASLTENGRCAYPLDFIPNASLSGVAGHPRNIVMLTADAFGVLPPIARLSPAQAMYHFLSGYTAKVAGTEKGVTEPQATFSTCFGAPFMPRHPSEYGDLLRDLISRHQVDCWLVNTGWTGGAYGTGKRMPITVTRALLRAALSGALKGARYRIDPNFGFSVPIAVEGVDAALLDPRATWADPAAYDAQAARLVGMFISNFEKFADHVDAEVLSAAPAKLQAAE
jgi:phosphoenolpyruvate carboxykinase (ATP)